VLGGGSKEGKDCLKVRYTVKYSLATAPSKQKSLPMDLEKSSQQKSTAQASVIFDSEI